MTEEHDIWTLIALLGHSKHKQHWDTRAEEIRALLDAGADPDVGREAPLLMAARMGHLPVAEALLASGADVHGGLTYLTPLCAAGKRTEMRELLLAHGATETPFSLYTSGDVAALRKLVQGDPAVAQLADEADRTLLFYAAALHDRQTMEVLLDAGADPSAVAKKSQAISPIHEVCRGRGSGGVDEVRLLQERGAALDALNGSGVTALHMAVRDRNVDVVRALLEAGALVDVEDKGRRSTPLRRAVANTGRQGTSDKADRALEVVRLLLEHSADPNHKNRTGKPVIASTRNAAIRQLLADAGGA